MFLRAGLYRSLGGTVCGVASLTALLPHSRTFKKSPYLRTPSALFIFSCEFRSRVARCELR